MFNNKYRMLEVNINQTEDVPEKTNKQRTRKNRVWSRPSLCSFELIPFNYFKKQAILFKIVISRDSLTKHSFTHLVCDYYFSNRDKVGNKHCCFYHRNTYIFLFRFSLIVYLFGLFLQLMFVFEN